jgi:fructuronate reductase
VVSRFAAMRDPDLGAFVEGEVAFPSTMVDRIVPASTPRRPGAAAGLLGVEDAWPVGTEPFSQWVIEDRFPADGRGWRRPGAELVADVAPYETMKLRLLNGAHSTMAYLGYLMGRETIAEAIRDPGLARLVRGLWDEEITPTLRVPPGADVEAYKAELLRRFANPALRHRTWQIAMDGSQKLPQRLLEPARERLRAGAPLRRIALAVAGWMRYAAGIDEAGRPIDVRDPLVERFQRIAAAAGSDPRRRAEGFLALTEVFGDDLGLHPDFRRR